MWLSKNATEPKNMLRASCIFGTMIAKLKGGLMMSISSLLFLSCLTWLEAFNILEENFL